jgi:hypothetical protein
MLDSPSLSPLRMPTSQPCLTSVLSKVQHHLLLFFMFMPSGPLVVRGSSMVSLSVFAHLLAVDARNKALAEVNGALYSMAVYGLLANAMHQSFLQAIHACKTWATSWRSRPRVTTAPMLLTTMSCAFPLHCSGPDEPTATSRTASIRLPYDSIARDSMMHSATRRARCIP